MVLCSVPLGYPFTIFVLHLVLLCFPKPVLAAFLWNCLIPGNWCAIKAKSWKYMRITSPWGSPKLMTDGYRQLYSITYTLSSPMRVSWSYPLQDSAWDDIATWLSPISHLTSPFLSNFPWEYFFNKSLAHKSSSQGLHLGNLTETSIEKVQSCIWNVRVYSIVNVVTAEEAEGGVMAKLP